jgi:hypothetical protein
MHRHFYAAADEADELIQELRPVLEGHTVLTVMMALGELLACTLATDRLDAVAREAFLRSVVGRAADMAGDGPRVH